MLSFIFSSWILLVLLSVVFRTILYAVQKEYSESYSEGMIMLMISAGGALILAPVTVYIILTNTITFNQLSVSTVLISGILNAIAIVLLTIALKEGDLSIVGPLSSIGPLVTAIVEPTVRSIVIPPTVVIGSFITVAGVVILSSDGASKEDIKKALTKKSTLFAFLTSLCYGIASIADATGTKVLHPVVFSEIIMILMTIVSIGYIYTYDNTDKPLSNHLKTENIKKFLGVFTILGGLKAGHMYWLFYGFPIAPSATQVSILIQSTNIGLITIGWLFFNEKNIGRRLIGAIIIMIGISLAL